MANNFFVWRWTPSIRLASFGDDLEAWRVATVDDLDGPATDSRKGGSEPRSQGVGIGKDALEERNQASGVRGSDQDVRFEPTIGIAASETRPRFRPSSIKR